jgi:hypothetical protein
MDNLTIATITGVASQLNGINASLQKITILLQNQPFWDTQLFAVVLGALLGLLPFIYLVWKDRPIIKVEVSQALIPFDGLGGRLSNGLTIKISNSGRRQITLQGVFLVFKSGETLIFPKDNLFVGGSRLPVTLTENTSHEVIILSGDLAKPVHKKQEYPIAACYRSATGRVYKCKMKTKFWDNIFKVSENLSK